MKKVYTFLVFVLSCCLCQFAFGQFGFTSSPSLTSEELAQKIAGQGVDVFNVNKQCADEASGFFFNGTSTGLGMEEGILLTTGSIYFASSTNNISSIFNNTPGDTDLEQLPGVPIGNYPTYDACILEFDFISSGNEVSLSYVFGSEEYPENIYYQDADIMAIFIQGGFEYEEKTNISTIPDSPSLPVAIKYINEDSYKEYYANDIVNLVRYDGYTVPMTATAAVSACQTYHLKITITDVGDGKFWAQDSGIFLEENSFQCSTPSMKVSVDNIPNQEIAENCGSVSYDLLSLEVVESISIAPSIFSNNNYQVLLDGTAVLGEDYTISTNELSLDSTDSFTITPIEDNIVEEVESIAVSLVSSCHPAIVLFTDTVYLKEALAIHTETSINVCESGSVIPLSVFGGDDYSWTPTTGLSCTDCPNPIATIQEDITYTVFAERAGCVKQENIEIVVDDGFENAMLSSVQNICSTESISLQASGGLNYQWNTVMPNGLDYLSCQDCPNPTFQPPLDGDGVFDYEVLISSTSDCFRTLSTSIEVIQPDVELSNDYLRICQGEFATVEVSGSGSFVWLNESGVTVSNGKQLEISPNQTTEYELIVVDGNCPNVRKKVLIEVDELQAEYAASSVFVCENEEVTLAAISGNEYQWLDMDGNLLSSEAEFNVFPSSNINYQLVVSNDNCMDTVTAAIAVEPTRTVEFITSSPRICGSQTSVDIAIQPITGVTFEWEPAEYFTMSSQDGSVITATPPDGEDSFTYTVTPVTALRCSPSASIDVVVSEELEITVDAPEVLCVDLNNPIPFIVNAFGAETYTWGPFGPILPPAPGSSDAFLFPNPGNNDVIFTVYGESANGECVGEHTFQIEVIQQPDISVDVPVICAGELGLMTVDIEGGSGDFEYEWIPTNGLGDPNGATTFVGIEESTTYTLIVTDLVGGCDVVQEVEVEVPIAIEADISPISSICEGGEVVLSVTNVETETPISWTDNEGNTYEGNNITVSPDNTTTYTATVGEICPLELNTVVEVPNLDLQINATDIVICNGETIELTAIGAATFEWFPVAGINNTSAASQVLSPSETTTYSVTGYSANEQCSKTTEITIKVNSVTINSPLNVQVCGGEESVYLEVDGGEGAVYNWSPSIGLSSTTLAGVLASPLETTVYTVNVRTIEGCEENIPFLVEVFGNFDVSVSPSHAEVCRNKSQVLTLSGAVEYNFSAEENQEFEIFYLSPDVVEITAMTDLNLTIEGVDENGCQATTQASVEIVEAIIELSEYTQICGGETTQLFADGGEGASYLWEPANSLNDPTLSNPTASPTETTVYTVQVTNAQGCSDVGTVVVEIPSQIDAELTAESETFCEGESVLLTVLVNNPQLYTYEWYEENGELLAATESNSFTVTPTATTSYVVYIYNELDCAELGMIELTLNQPVIEVQDGTACIGGDTVMSASGLGPDASYEWQPAESVVCQNPSCSVVRTVPFFEETNIDFTISGTNSQGCSATTEANLSVSQGLNLGLNIDLYSTTICMGEDLELIATGASNFTWEGEWLSSPFGNTVLLSSPVPGIYIYTLNGTSGDCEADLYFEITVNEAPQIITENRIICKGENTLLEASGLDGLDYKWLDENGNEIIDLNVSPTETTTYTVIGIDVNGCQTTANLTIEVRDIEVELSANSTSICEGESASLTAIGENIVVYSWTTGETPDNIVVAPTETTTYGIVVTNSEGCTADTEITIEVSPNPSIQLTNSYLACANEALLVEATTDLQNGSLQWTPAIGVDNPTVSNPIISATETTIYTLTATNDFGCEAIAETTIDITNECVFPGDADNNGEVNMFDLFPMGANFGASEFARNSISNEWQGFGVFDWSATQSNGQNLKYVDCNGNGSIGFEDTTAIIQNFDLFQKSKGFVKGSLADPELLFEPTADLIGAGEMLEMQVWLGSEENPAIDLYAIAFETTFDINLIDPNSISMDFSGSDLGTHNVGLLAVSLVNRETGRVNVSMSRTASPGANGEVYLLTIRMRTLESLESANSLTFNISDFGATNSNEETILANTDELPTIMIDPDIVDIEGITSFSKPYLLYPTFAQEGFQLTYTLQKSPTIEVNLFDLSGQKVGVLLKENQSLGSHQEEVDLTKWSLGAGVYIVELQLDGKVYREKIVVL